MFKNLILISLFFTLISCSDTTSEVVVVKEATHDFELKEDIHWASPKGFELTMDIYTPNTGKESYPVVLIFHGGAWLINNKSIMNQSAEYLASRGEYVICNVNYRLLGDMDNTVHLNEIVEDVLGAVLWVKANIADYKGDPKKITVTGDSAGGHLAMITVLQGQKLSSTGFSQLPLGFNPSWMPPGKTHEEINKENGLAVQAAMISYGSLNVYKSALFGFETPANFFWSMAEKKPRGLFGDTVNVHNKPEFYKMVSPAHNIPMAENTTLPPLLFTVGEKDNLTTPKAIKRFIEDLKSAGHENIEFWEHEGRPHAFLDSGSNKYLGITFEKDAPPALDVMIEFLNATFYK